MKNSKIQDIPTAEPVTSLYGDQPFEYQPTATAFPANEIVQQTTTVPPGMVRPQYLHVGGRKPVMLTRCPHCASSHKMTRIHTKTTGTTWVCVVAGAVIFWPLCWVPLVAKPFKQTNHYCKHCGTKIGRVKPFQ